MLGLSRSALTLALISSSGCLMLWDGPDDGAPDCPDEPCDTRSTRAVVPDWYESDGVLTSLARGYPGIGSLEVFVTWEGGQAWCDIRERECEGMEFDWDPEISGTSYVIDAAPASMAVTVLYDGQPVLSTTQPLEYERTTYHIEYYPSGINELDYVTCDGCLEANLDLGLEPLWSEIEQTEGYPGMCDLDDPAVMEAAGVDVDTRLTFVDDGRHPIDGGRNTAYALLTATEGGRVSITLEPDPDEGPGARRLRVAGTDCRVLAEDRSRIPGIVMDVEAGQRYAIWVSRPDTERPDELVVRQTQ